MGKVTTIKGNLFDAPKGTIIAHACNTKGVWGSGIAKEFAKRFPVAAAIYRKHCLEHGSSLLGSCLLIPAGDYTIACLFTSKNFGAYVDSPDSILTNTFSAVMDMILQNGGEKEIHMCKINSGLFNVPWKDTKKLLKSIESSDFTVYDY
jgi:ADP-ribose 1''-phosphate phosphatase